ncbi:ABC transporter permease [Aquimarina longa]|uniref:ABC transporter permease n=1 Tax=Aquimarina longa TaxID=1080221 RepID=UPI00078648BA|nr:ABC transporter permease [Aquimarina longa]
MYTLYLKIAIRHLLKNKLYSFLNILGLAIGLASFTLIMIYVNYERSYDTFEGSENVYRVYMDYKKGNIYEPGDAQTYNLTGPTIKRKFPEVLEQVRLYKFDEIVFTYNSQVFKEKNGSLADPSYFDVFGYSLLKGDINSVLQEPNTIILTHNLASKLFGDKNPIGNSIFAFVGGNKTMLRITGVMDNVPETTHMKTNFLISYSTINTWNTFDKYERELNWNQNHFFTYLKIDKNANIKTLKTKIMTLDFSDNFDERHNIEPLEDIHLYSNKPYETEINGSATRVKFLTAIAFIILILSWLNYINLSTTKSLERAKEIGIRKVTGAKKSQLIIQSIVESVILNLVAFLLVIAISMLVLSVYNKITTGGELILDMRTIKQLLPVFGIVVFGVMLASLYPAFLLSSYKPSKALKGKIRTSTNGLHIRKGLVVIQFVATIVLIIGTIVITRQINHLQNQPLETSLNNIVAFSGQLLTKKDSILSTKLELMKNKIKKLPNVSHVMTTQTFPGDDFMNLSSAMGIIYPDGTNNNNKVYYNYEINSPEYFEMMDMKFVAGNTFLSHSTYKNRQVVINEEMAKMIGMSNPIEAVGQKIKFWSEDWNIIGVIKNYHHFGLKKPVIPLIIRHGRVDNYMLVKFDTTIISTSEFMQTITQIENLWKQTFSKSTFDYTFVDKQFDAQYNDDKQFSAAFRVFTMLAIFIAALGLFGLSSYTCIQRKKEIGIRKVNGASVFGILKLLNIDFLKWIGVAFIIAIPIAWYTMNSWLENFALKTSLSWWIFILSGVITLSIILLTVSWQSFIVANKNPATTLRDE